MKHYIPDAHTRTSWLSQAPGGSTVIFIFEDTFKIEYDRIKNVDQYIKKVFSTTDKKITEIWVNGTLYFHLDETK